MWVEIIPGVYAGIPEGGAMDTLTADTIRARLARVHDGHDRRTRRANLRAAVRHCAGHRRMRPVGQGARRAGCNGRRSGQIGGMFPHTYTVRRG